MIGNGRDTMVRLNARARASEARLPASDSDGATARPDARVLAGEPRLLASDSCGGMASAWGLARAGKARLLAGDPRSTAARAGASGSIRAEAAR